MLKAHTIFLTFSMIGLAGVGAMHLAVQQHDADYKNQADAVTTKPTDYAVK